MGDFFIPPPRSAPTAPAAELVAESARFEAERLSLSFPPGHPARERLEAIEARLADDTLTQSELGRLRSALIAETYNVSSGRAGRPGRIA